MKQANQLFEMADRVSLSPSLLFSRFIALYERCAYFGENRQAHDVEYNHA